MGFSLKMSESHPTHWEVELERIIVPGETSAEACTKAVEFILDSASEGDVPLITSIKKLTKEEVINLKQEKTTQKELINHIWDKKND